MWCTSAPPASARRPETRWRCHLSRWPGFGVHLFEPAVALLKRRRNARELILGVWLQGGLYAARHLTDGHVPHTVVESLPRDIVRVLIEVGLWLETDSGIQIHDYLVYNPSSVTVLHKREKARKRQESHRNRDTVTPLLTRDNERDTENVTALVTRDSRARGTPPHPTPLVPDTHIPSSTSVEPTAWGWWHDLWAKRWPHGILQMPQTKGAYIPVYNRCSERHLALPLLVVLDKSPLGSRFRATVKEGRGDLFWCAWNVDALVILRRLLLRSGSLALRHAIEGYAIKSRYGSRLPSMPRTTAAIWSSVSSSR